MPGLNIDRGQFERTIASLVTITGMLGFDIANWQGFGFSDGAGATFPELNFVGGIIYMENNNWISDLNFPKMVECGGLNIVGTHALRSFTAPVLKYVCRKGTILYRAGQWSYCNFHWQNNYAFQSDPDLRSLEVLGGANSPSDGLVWVTQNCGAMNCEGHFKAAVTACTNKDKSPHCGKRGIC